MVYTSPDRDLAHSTAINVSSVSRVTQPGAVLNDSVLYAMYGLDLDDMLVRRIRVTLGQTDDGGYQKSSYQAW